MKERCQPPVQAHPGPWHAGCELFSPTPSLCVSLLAHPTCSSFLTSRQGHHQTTARPVAEPPPLIPWIHPMVLAMPIPDLAGQAGLSNTFQPTQPRIWTPWTVRNVTITALTGQVHPRRRLPPTQHKHVWSRMHQTVADLRRSPPQGHKNPWPMILRVPWKMRTQSKHASDRGLNKLPPPGPQL